MMGNMEVFEQIKQLPKRKPVSFGKQSYASDLVFIHVLSKRVYGTKIPTYVSRTERGRTKARRWCMRRVPWVFTKDVLKRAGMGKYRRKIRQ